jgi:glycosyltransferase involved in cell wall biosynthesis
VKILFLIRDLEFRGGPKQLSLLAPALPRARFEVCVGMLKGNGPFSGTLQASGMRVEALGWNRLVDFRPFWELQKLLKNFRPDLIHCCDMTALRALALVGNRAGSRLIVTLPFATQYFRSLKDFRSIWRLDRWLLRTADRLVVQFPADLDCWRACGLGELVVVPPGVASRRHLDVDRSEACRALGLPRHLRWLLCVGPLEVHKGFRDAIWTFNILGFLFPDVRLVFVGDGPDRERLERFTTVISAERFLMAGAQADLELVLAHADAIWIPSRRPSGINVALEAMAAGKPVVATHLPRLAEIVVEGETGFLVPPGDKGRLARQTRLLLEDTDLRCRLGEAGRRRVESHYSVAQLAQRLADLYESVVRGRQANLSNTAFLSQRRVG